MADNDPDPKSRIDVPIDAGFRLFDVVLGLFSGRSSLKTPIPR